MAMRRSSFMDDLSKRLARRVQLTSDAHRGYLDPVEGAFGNAIDYAMLVKIYGEAPEAEKQYSTAQCRTSLPKRFQSISCITFSFASIKRSASLQAWGLE